MKNYLQHPLNPLNLLNLPQLSSFFSSSLLLLPLFLSPPSSSAQSTCFVIAHSGLNLRAAPEMKAKVLSTIPFGEKVVLLDNDPIQTDGNYQEFVVEEIAGHWQYAEYKQQKGWVFSGFLNCAELFDEPGPGDLNRDWVLIPNGAVCSSIHYRRDFQWYALVRNGLRSSLQKTNIRFRFADELTEEEKSDGDFTMSVDLDIPSDSVLFLIGTKKDLQEGPLTGVFTADNWGFQGGPGFLYPEMKYHSYIAPRNYTFKAFEHIRLHPEADNGYFRRYNIQCTAGSAEGEVTFDLSQDLNLMWPASEHVRLFSPQLMWTGDLDRDGWLDCIFKSHEGDGCGVTWYHHLLMSDPSNKQKPLKKVAEMEEYPCL